MPNLIVALIASVGIVVGSFGPWVNFFAITGNGVDINLRSGWGGTLTLGAVSAVVLFTQLNLGRSGSSPWWFVPVAAAVPACGVVSFILAVVYIVRVRSLPFGTSLAAQVGWGLWMVAAASVVLVITAAVTLFHLPNQAKDSTAFESWFEFWQATALLGIVAIVGYTGSVWSDVTKPESVSILNLDPLNPSKSARPAAPMPTDSPGVGDQPNVSSAPTTSSPPTAANGALMKQIGERAAFTRSTGPDAGASILDFAVTDITINTCDKGSPPLEAPENGSLIVIKINAATHSETVPDWGNIFAPKNWQVIGPDGYTDLNVDTFSSFACTDQRPPENFSLNSKYSFAVVLDSKYSAGQVLFKPFDDYAGWAWDIP
jgi:hypothetical protein